jgi:hypothetical protein
VTARTHLVIPAKAGTSCRQRHARRHAVPAFAGMTESAMKICAAAMTGQAMKICVAGMTE